jgi:hypothetical protein
VVTDVVKPPEDAAFGRVASCGDGVFILTVSRPEGDLAFWLRVDAAGQPEGLTPAGGHLLPAGCHQIAASLGGTILGYTVVDRSPPPRTTEAGLVDVTTGERRLASFPPGVIRYLSLANDGQTVAFQLESRSDVASGSYVAAATARDWVSQGTRLDDPHGHPYDAISPVISADGQAVYITVAQPDPAGGPHWNRLLEIPAGGGAPRVLFEMRYKPDRYNVHYMWGNVCRDPAGSALLAFATGCVYRIGISSGAATRLPFPEGQPYDAAW